MTTTDRLALPLLAAGQAQKEMTHNAALSALDVLVQPVVQAVAPAAIPATPSPGQCWIVGQGATGAWAGQDGSLAAWTAGGWQFYAPSEGFSCWSIGDRTSVRFGSGHWTIGTVAAERVVVNDVQVVGAQQPSIASPSGGVIIDTQCRATVDAIRTALVQHGLIAA